MTRKRRIAMLGLDLCLVLIISILGPVHVMASPQTKTAPPRKAPPTSNQMTNIPYYTLRDGLSSTLTLNNLTTSAMPVTVTLYNTQGKAQMLNPITLDPHAFKQIELGDVVASDEFDSGNVEIAFSGITMAVTSQVSVYSKANRVSFESREADMMEFESSKLAGIASLPKGADGFLAVTNTAATKVTVQLMIGRRKQEVPLFPRQTEVVKLSDAGNEHRDGAILVSLQHDGMPGDVIATGYTLNMKDGYSSAFTISDPGNLRSSTLAGVHFRAGGPDPSEGFPEDTNFRSPLLLANVGTKPVSAKVSVDYTIEEKAKVTPVDPKKPAPIDQKFSTVSVKQLTIAPGDVQRIELSDELAGLGDRRPPGEAGVDITYDGPAGSVIGQLTSSDQSGDYSFEVPIKDPADPMAMVESAYPWTTENGTDTVLHLKNTTEKSVSALAIFVFPDGGGYSPDRIVLEPHQSIALDIQKLKDAKKPDVQKQIFPANEGHGLLFWHQEDPASMIGRAEQTNVKEGIARSFSCESACCDNFYWNSFQLGPSSLTGAIGGSGSFQGYESFTNCSGETYPNSNYLLGYPVSAGWDTSDSSVATVSGGDVSYVGAGTATITANFTYPEYNQEVSCVVGATWPDAEEASVTVLPPDHVVILNDSNGPPGACSTTGIWVRQMTVSLQDANNVTVPQNYSTVETYSDPSSPTSSCPSPWNVAPVASSCGVTTTGYCPTCTGTWTDTLAVANNFCSSGITVSSACGFSETSTWAMCSNGLTNNVWTSPRQTLSDGITANSNSTQFTTGTKLYP